MNRPTAQTLTLAITLGLFAACGETADPPPKAADTTPMEGAPNAQPALVADLRADLEAARHPSDGGGRARLDAGPTRIAVRSPGRWTFVYEAGELGIAPEGVIFLQVSPFWNWSAPQTRYPEAPGYTEVTTEALGLEIEALAVDQQLLAIRVIGRAMAPGETIRIVYGAGPAKASSDRFAERGSPFWFAVDGDGDGVRQLVPDPPRVDVLPSAPARVVIALPSTARPGDRVRATVAILDREGNAGIPYDGALEFESLGPGILHPSTVTLGPADSGTTAFPVRIRSEGVYRLRAATASGLQGESNPMIVADGAPRLLWADLHGHTSLSDGTGSAHDYFAYARDAAGLDVVALTDHDHWGMPFLDATPEMWEEIRDAVKRFHQPGDFVALLGFEWTNWVHGHRHVLYFENDGPILSSVDPRYDTPEELWRGLDDRDAITLAHHSAGGPVATNWNIAPHPRFEPVTEIVSVHGSSEALDSPARIYSPIPGNFVRDVLDRGTVLGFVGSGDSHDGHPGLAHLASPTGGLAGIWSEARTREGVLEALRARRTYATSGPRILLRMQIDDAEMGSQVEWAEPRNGELHVTVAAPAPLSQLEVIRSGEIAIRVELAGERELSWSHTLDAIAPGEYVYVRITQRDGGLAWSSPIFFRSPLP